MSHIMPYQDLNPGKMDFTKNDEKDECLLENCQIIQVHGKQQGRRLDKPAKSVSEESQPEGVQYNVPTFKDVWDGC